MNPSKEVQRQAREEHKINPIQMVLAAMFFGICAAAGAEIISKGVANLAHLNFNINQGK